jgi:hypothetical protein
VRHVALAVLVALVVTVGAVAPVVAGASSSGGVYQISEMDVPASVTTDESFTVSAMLSNSGGIDMQVVAFRIDANGDGEFTPNESLGAEAFVLLEGASRNVTFDVAVPEDLAPGEYEYMLYTESGNETGTITVESPLAPATFLLSGVSGPESVAGGESFAVETSVANVGDLNGSETLSLYLDTDGDGNLTDEAALANTTFELASASNGSVGLNATAPEVAPGQYTYAVGTSTEMLTGTVNITEPPAPFDVTSLRASRTMVSGSLSVSTIVENTGDEKRTGTVELRLDTNGDGEFSASEIVRTRELSLGIGASQQHGFSVALPDSYTPGEYEIALVTPTTERVETFEVYRPSSTSSSSSGSEEITSEAVSQALYGTDAENLSGSQVMTVEDIRNRLADGESGTSVDEIRSLEEIIDEMYDRPFDELTNAELLEAQNAYDAQFETPMENPPYTRTEIARAVFPKFTGTYDDLSGESAVEVAELYNRQPFVENVTASNVETREQVAERILGIAMPGGEKMGSTTWEDLTKEELLEVQAVYESQFE